MIDPEKILKDILMMLQLICFCVQSILNVAFGCLAFYATIHPPTKKKVKVKFKWIGGICAALGLTATIVLYVDSQISEKQKDRENKQLQSTVNSSEAEVRKLHEDMRAYFEKISSEFSTNSGIAERIRSAVLTDAQKQLDTKEKIKEHEISELVPVDSEAVIKITNSKIDLQEIKDEKKINQQQIDDLNANNAQQKKQQSADAIRLQKIKLLSGKVLPIFDRIIARINIELGEFSTNSGEVPHTTFPGNTPTIYGSNLVRDENIANGTNTISLGTNSAWLFTVVTDFSADSSTSRARWGLQQVQTAFASICIISQTTNGESSLKVTVSMKDLLDERDGFENFAIGGIETVLSAPGKLAALNSDVQSAPDKWTNDVDQAIYALLGAQNEQCPIGTIK